MRLFLFNMFFVSLFGMEGIYIWSKTFDSLDNKIINNINVDTFIISSSNTQKIKDFLNLTTKKVSFLLSNNQYIYPKNRDKIDKKIQFYKQFNNYIHLDVEPHTIPTLKPYKEQYLKMYIQMLKYIKTKYPSLHIDISIPTFYKVSYVKEMSKYVDYIYLMAYKYKNIPHLVRKVNKYKDLNIVVVFNCKDYDNFNQLINDIKALKQSIKISNIAYHSLKTCMMLKGKFEITQ